MKIIDKDKKLFDTIRKRCKKFNDKLSEEIYLQTKNIGSNNIEFLYKKFEDIGNISIIKKISSLLKRNKNPDFQKRAKYLNSALIKFFVNFQSRNIDEEFSNVNNEIELCCKIQNFPDNDTQISNNFNSKYIDETKNKIFELRMKAKQLMRRRINYSNEIAQTFGYDNYAEIAMEKNQNQIEFLHGQLKIFLENTSKTYSKLLTNYLSVNSEHRNKKSQAINLYDICKMFSLNTIKFLPKFENALMLINKTLLFSGIDTYYKGYIKYEIKNLSSLSRSFCYSIKRPQNNIIITSDTNTNAGWYNFHHELGHAIHFAYTKTNLPFEYKNLGDNGTTETFAMLFGKIANSNEWISYLLKKKLTKFDILIIDLKELFLIRRYIAKFIFNVNVLTRGTDNTLNENDIKDYNKIINSTCFVNANSNSLLMDFDPNFICINYLKAWFLSLKLNNHFTNEYGPFYFLNPAWGKIIKNEMQWGQKYSPEEVSLRITNSNLTYTENYW